jgi:hypothetical protein
VHCKRSGTTSQYNADAKCRQCGADIAAHQIVEGALKKLFEIDDYLSVKNGAEGVLDECPECSNETYIMSPDERVALGAILNLAHACGVRKR